MPDWRLLAVQAADIVGTPCYVLSESCIRENLAKLAALETSVQLRHWVSLKTQPVARLVHAAIELGLGIDVVSEYELAGVLDAGVAANSILVNGVGKRRWLLARRISDISVHFDSISEVQELVVPAKRLNWRVGLRCAIPHNASDSRSQGFVGWDQFGMDVGELKIAVALLRGAGVKLSGLHFHLHSNVSQVGEYREALERVADLSDELRLEPEYIDIGGGLPIAGETMLDGSRASDTFNVTEFSQMLARVPIAFPSIREIWMENGRFLTGSAGVLVMTVLDKKKRGDTTYLICDGGRVNHARLAASEVHDIILAPAQTALRRKMMVCGPTCSALDRLGCWMLPESVAPGDRIIWQNAGAYHIPLETRFSTGLAPVVWFNAKKEPEVIRRRETPQEWWSQWASAVEMQVIPTS